MPNILEKYGPLGVIPGALGLTDSGPDSQTTTTNNTPWGPIQPYLLDYYKNASNWYNANPQGSVAPLSPYTQQAWNMQAQRAMQGSPVSQAAQQQAYNTLSGANLPGSFSAQFNPLAQQVGQAFQNITMPSINSTFSMAGRTGSGAQQAAIGQAENQLGQTLSGLAGDIYGKERGYQMAAMGMAPTLANQDYNDIAQLGAAGQGQMAYQQQLLNAPYQQLQQYGGLMAPGLGYGTSTTTQPLYSNPVSQYMSMAPMIYAMAAA